MSKTLYLIDGHAQVYRAFYAVVGLKAPDGRPTGAAFGFTRMLRDLLDNHRPDYIAAVFDAPGKLHRHERYPEYKATRKPTPPELLEQVPLAQEIARIHRLPVFSLEGYEADDILGTLARQAEAQGVEVVIVSGDKDCGQLITDHVRQFDPMKDKTWDAKVFEEEKGIAPALLPDVMGLVGDTSDNIPGVPKIGPKIGTELIAKYGSLEALLDHADEIKGKRGELLREHADQARLSKELATIDCAVPVELDLAACERREADADVLRPLFQELGFRSLLTELGDEAAESREYRLVATAEAFSEFLGQLKGCEHFSFDTETTGLDPMRADLVGLSFSWKEKEGWYLPLQAPLSEPRLDAEATLDALREILESETVTKTGQNLKYDALVLRRAGVTLRGIVFDSLLASNILDGHITEHGIDALASRHLGIAKIPTKDLIGSGKKQISMAEVPVETICEYACEDADVALRLERFLAEKLDAAGARKLLDELELPLSLVLTDMQAAGIRLDCDKLKAMSDEAAKLIEALEGEIHEIAGHAFNIASPKQLGQVLFEEMSLPVVKKTKTGASTDESVLQELAARGHELPERVLAYRSYAKLKNTYLDALPEMVNPETGRVHTTFGQTTTATGRLSSHDPNLQNIPVRTDYGRAIRAAFVPEPGWKMMAADYSQVELRMLAHFSGDERLRQAFADNRDIHRVVASQVYGVDEDEVTREQRSAAKAVNFGIIYGQTAHGLSRGTGMNRGEAQLFIDSYFEQFPQVRQFIHATIAQAHEDGFVQTLLGRRREIPELASTNKARCARAEREAVNTVIQGSAADLIKTAMISLHGWMPKMTPRSRMLLQIHDELVFECPPEETDALRDLVRQEMETALGLKVPVTVDLGVGDNWLEVK